MSAEQPPRPSSELSLRNLVPACLAGMAAAYGIGRAGMSGTLIGAGIAPVLYIVIKQLAQRQAERVAAPPRPRPRGRARSYLALAAASLALAVALVTTAELVLGRALTGRGETTFVSREALAPPTSLPATSSAASAGRAPKAAPDPPANIATTTSPSAPEEPTATAPPDAPTTTTAGGEAAPPTPEAPAAPAPESPPSGTAPEAVPPPGTP